VSEDSPPPSTADTPAGEPADLTRDGLRLPDGSLTGVVVGRLADQARQTVSAARARRLRSDETEPGVLDLTPLREVLGELADALSKLRLRDRTAHALRAAADMIDPQTPNR
jgi:hypothetical protein